MGERLHFVLRTPHEVVVDDHLRAARVPTETGQVGLRPGQEPFVAAIAPGLCLLRDGDRLRFAATARGLLEAGRDGAVLYTPFAVAGDRGEDVLAALDRALAAPESELVVRRRMGELERHIVQQLRSPAHRSPRGAGHG